MLFYQGPYNENVKEFAALKLQDTSGIDSEKFLYYILLASLFFICLSISMTVDMVIRRNRQNIIKAKDDILIERYQNFLSNMLILPIDSAFLGINKNNENEYRLDPTDISDSRCRKILAKEIYALKKDLSGSQENQLNNYFFGLGLQAEVIEMIASKNLETKMKALKMIHSFNIIECHQNANQYIHSSHRDLAILAIQNRIKIENSVKVLYEIKVKLNDWECHKIIHTINSMNISSNEIQNLKQQLTTENYILDRLSIGLVKKETPILALR